MKLRGFSAYLAMFLFCAGIASGQTVSDANQTGFPVFGTFHGSDLDVVSLQNGNLHIEIPIASFPQRHRHFTYRFVYDTPSYTLIYYKDPAGVYWSADIAQGEVAGVNVGWRMGSPFGWSLGYQEDPISCTVSGLGTITNSFRHAYVLTDPDGGKHPLALSYEVVPPNQIPCLSGSNQTTSLTLDGTGVWVQTANPGRIASQIVLKDGTEVVNNSWKDSNGNTASPSSDMLGRNNLVTTNGTTYNLYTATDSNGKPQTFRVDYISINVTTNFCPLRSNLTGGPAPCTEYTSTWQVPSRLTLPDGLYYQFTWNGDGTLQRMDLPTGGSIAYTYGVLRFNGVYSGAACFKTDPNCVPTTTYPVRQAVTSRAVTSNGTTAKWNYSGFPLATAGSNLPPYATTVTDPLGNQQVHSFAACGNSSYETQVKYYQGSTLIRTVNKDYGSDPDPTVANSCINLRLIRETTVLANGLTKKTETDYETSTASCSPDACTQGSPYTTTWLNPTNIREYDWVAAGTNLPDPLLRTTSYTYLHAANPNYLNANIADRPTSKTVYDGKGNIAAYETYSYDSTPLATDVTTAPSHDPAAGPSFTIRGNLTETDQQVNTGGAYLATVNTYDILGQLRSTKDPNGNVTSFDYSDSWSGASCPYAGSNTYAYLTKTTNAKGHTSKSQYFLCTGLAQAHQDQNDINAGSAGTTFTYDLMNRPVTTNFPDGGSVNYDYSDNHSTATPLWASSSTLINPSLSTTRISVLDGLGRIQQHKSSVPTAQCGSGYTYQDFSFDLLGRSSTTSNPYCTTSDSTYGVTTTGYDAINRITQVTKQDGSVSKVAYDVAPPSGVQGNCTTSTDEALKQRMACSDALGRLTTVFEDPAGLNYETDYQYNALDNLLRVDQKGSAPATSGQWRTRTFSYDSLSRLITAYNPESGTICYGVWANAQCANGYDADGNLLAKTDARGITTSYSYDALNRVTQKTFSNGDPTLTFTYDQSPDPTWGAGSSVGRLVRALKNGLGSHWFSYDAMGRVARTWQCLPSNCNAGASVAAQYDLAGGLTQLTYPNGQIVKYTPDSAGRHVSAIDTGARFDWPKGTTSNTGTTANFATAATYGADSGLTGFISGANPAGGFVGITNTFVYNNRLQLCRTAASTTGAVPTSCTNSFGNVLDLNYDYHPPGTGDNGNVYAITNYRDTTRSQTFAYDALNRLISAQNNGTDCTKKTLSPNQTVYWGNSYTYDAWGNLLAKTVTKCSAEPLNENSDTQNRMHVISGPDYSYDLAGNMTYDVTGGHSYTYDGQSQITQVDSGTTATYTYDAEGNRLRKDSGSSPGTEYVYFGDQIIAEKNVATGVWSNYIFFDGRRVARQDFSSNAVSYYFSDHLKTADVITDATGKITSESDYYPWGGELPFVANDSNHYKFTSKERDTETQLDYFGARYYSNGLGRFISADWSATPVPVPYADLTDPQTLDQYSYVRNIPTRKADPDGHCPQCIVIVVELIEIGISGGEIATVAGGGAVLGATAGVATNKPSSLLSQPVMEPGGYSLGRYYARQNDPTFDTTPIQNQLNYNQNTQASNSGSNQGSGSSQQGSGSTQSSGPTGPYKRPNNATTKEQRDSVQGKPCATCGRNAGQKNNADHIDPLVEQHYRGGIDKEKMHDVNAVRPQCQPCSNQQGGFLSGFSKAMKKLFTF